jgi:hypothetical protein
MPCHQGLSPTFFAVVVVERPDRGESERSGSLTKPRENSTAALECRLR